MMNFTSCEYRLTEELFFVLVSFRVNQKCDEGGEDRTNWIEFL